jgi:hypothetical protein
MDAEGRGSVSFQEDIKPLFRSKDQHAMASRFDLFSYADVSNHADAILERLGNGTMPCDGPWTGERVELFDQWVRGGKLP